MLTKLFASLLAIACISVTAIASPLIVIKKGKKSEKVKPLEKSEVNVVTARTIVRDVNWEIDGQKDKKMKILKGIEDANPDLACH